MHSGCQKPAIGVMFVKPSADPFPGHRYAMMILRMMFTLTVSFLVTVLPAQGRAEGMTPATLLLVHGYVSDPDGWRDSGITGILEANAWQRGGTFVAGVDGRLHLNAIPGNVPKRYYLADLPSEAPLGYQAELLEGMISQLSQQRPRALLYAVGHSAGGVALRLAMVRRPNPGIQGLITIASPHRGTESAKLAGFMAQTPMALMAPFAGMGTLNRSRGLYADLTPEESGNLLFWLNHSEHPKGHYLAIVRESGPLLAIDPIVSSDSQDLTRVQALGRRAERVESGSGHSLEARDGNLIVEYLERWMATAMEP